MILSWREIFNSNNQMDEEVEEIESLDPPDIQEEPWCSTCQEFTDYRRKWDSVSRGDLDGGVYSDLVESPYCIECGSPMLLLSSCKRLVRWTNLLTCTAFALAILSVWVLFGINPASLFGLSVFGLFCLLTSRMPQKSRLALMTWKKAQKEENLKQLIQKL